MKAVFSEHVHKFVIPVEWDFVFEYQTGNVRKDRFDETPVAKKVTKLRCECGEETER